MVDRLRELGIEALGVRTNICIGEAAGLLNALLGDEDVILLDAVVTGAPVGSVHRWEGVPPAASKPSASTHGLGVVEALRLAPVLGRMPKSLRVYGIEGKQFAPGSPPSPQVKEAAEDLAQQIRTSIQSERTPK